MTDRSTALALLRRQLDDDDDALFRDGQWEAIDSIVNARARLLVVRRTGWGKSSVYFIATRILRDPGRGPTLIVSPLLALMRNQIAAAERLGIRAVTINSTNKDEWHAVQRAVLDDEADAMLVSPERLANDEFVEDVLLPVSGRIGLLVVDEVHCISDWGHDFRPDYRRLVNVLQRMPDNMPLVGTTATANDRVIADARAQLGRTLVQRGALMRETLFLQTMRLPTQAERLAWLADHVDELPGTGIDKVLKVLSVDNPAPITKDGAKWRRTPVDYRMDHDRVRRLTDQRETEWREVQSYVNEQGCLMAFLARALDDPDPRPCGRCASCRDGPILAPTYSRERVDAAARFLGQADMPLECNRRVRRGLLPEYGFSGNLTGTLDAGTGRILSRWGDAGWGTVVASDKDAGRFRDELVDAAAEMVRDRWGPEPPPLWVACVPSYNHPTLVPDFADRLAAALGLRFAPVVTKVRRNDPQKEQQNAVHQCRNLDGAFAVRGDLPDGPALLVDDVVDSGWTLTVVAALLRDVRKPVRYQTMRVGVRQASLLRDHG